ncbi:PTS glucose transporter subunit IIA [Streptomyces sp. CA-135486]
MSLAVHAPLSGVPVHVGIDTVRLNGEVFRTHVAEGEQVAVALMIRRAAS